MVYFSGHGLTGPRNELYLALTDTDTDELRVSALPFDLIREVFSDSPAANRVLILDCCFSGRAIQDMSGPDEMRLGQIAIEGTYTLTSTPANVVALAPPGADYTAFTGELIKLLRTGVPDGPELLTFATVYRRLLYTMTMLGLPLPRQRGTGTVDQLALVRNLAHHPHQVTALSTQQHTGVSPQAQTNTVTSHSTWSGEVIQDGFHAHGNRTLHMSNLLVMLAFGLMSITEDVRLWFYIVAGAATDRPSYFIAPVLLLIGAIFFLVLAVFASRLVTRPFNLRIDPRGIEVNIAGHCTFYHWGGIEKVDIRRIRDIVQRGICIYPRPGAILPQRPFGMSFPRLEKKTGWIFVAPLRGFNVSYAEIETALAQFAGFRWRQTK